MCVDLQAADTLLFLLDYNELIKEFISIWQLLSLINHTVFLVGIIDKYDGGKSVGYFLTFEVEFRWGYMIYQALILVSADVLICLNLSRISQIT